MHFQKIINTTFSSMIPTDSLWFEITGCHTGNRIGSYVLRMFSLKLKYMYNLYLAHAQMKIELEILREKWHMRTSSWLSL